METGDAIDLAKADKMAGHCAAQFGWALAHFKNDIAYHTGQRTRGGPFGLLRRRAHTPFQTAFNEKSKTLHASGEAEGMALSPETFTAGFEKSLLSKQWNALVAFCRDNGYGLDVKTKAVTREAWIDEPIMLYGQSRWEDRDRRPIFRGYGFDFTLKLDEAHDVRVDSRGHVNAKPLTLLSPGL